MSTPKAIPEPKLITNDVKKFMHKGHKKFDVYIQFDTKTEENVYIIENKVNYLTMDCDNREELETIFKFIMQK